jgi:hypothetical protein
MFSFASLVFPLIPVQRKADQRRASTSSCTPQVSITRSLLQRSRQPKGTTGTRFPRLRHRTHQH